MGKLINISGRLHSREAGETPSVVTGAVEVYDDDKQMRQSEINAELKAAVLTIPSKVSELENDSQYVTPSGLQQGLATKQDLISVVPDAPITEDSGNPSASVSFNNNQMAFAFRNLKGDRGNGIKSSSEELSGQDGQLNTHTIVDDDGREHVFHTRNGRTGAQGESAAHEGVGDLVLTNTFGSDSTKAMSQKAITDMVLQNFLSDWEEVSRSKDTASMYMKNDGSTKKFYSASGAYNHVYSLDVYAGDIIKVEVNSGAYGSVPGSIGFSQAYPVAGESYTELYLAASTSEAQFEKVVVAPSDGKIHVFMMSGTGKYAKFYKPIPMAEAVPAETAARIAAVSAEAEARAAADTALGTRVTDVETELGELSNVLVAEIPLPPSGTASTAAGMTGRVNVNDDHSLDTWNAASSGRYGWQYNVEEYRGKKMVLVPKNSKNMIYAFLTEGWKNGDSVKYCSGGVYTQTNATAIVIIPNDAVYFWCTFKDNSYDAPRPLSANIYSGVTEKMDEMMEGMENINEEIDLLKYTPLFEFELPPLGTLHGAAGMTGRITFGSDHSQDTWNANTTDNRYGWQCNIEAFRGKKLLVEPYNSTSWYRTAFAFLKTGFNSSSAGQTVDYCDKGVYREINEPVAVDIPDDATYFWCSFKETSTFAGMRRPKAVKLVGTISEKLESLNVEIKTYHVDETNGSDDNNGLTEDDAFQTVAKAVAMSGSDVSLILHGRFNTPISITGKNAVRIQGNDANIYSGTLIDSAEEATGYEGVYVASNVTLPANHETYGMWLWQLGVADENTSIELRERHPAQNNTAYRLRATKIVKADSAAAVESSDVPAYFYDSSAHNLYVKSPAAPSSSQPILIRAAEDDHSIHIECNELLMTRVNSIGATVMLNANKAQLIECRSLYGCHGFRNETQFGQAVYLRCEAAGNFAASGNGDGFGGGTSRSTLIDCWAHDCFDDGYSEHNGSRCTIIGGLYEYCGKGGIVPSGSYTSIIGVTCRYNGGKPGMNQAQTAGINFTLGAGDNVIGNVKNCVSYGNYNNYYMQSSSCSVTFEGCQSYNANANGAGYSKGDGAFMVLRNCTHGGTGAARNPLSSSAIIIENGTLVS